MQLEYTLEEIESELGYTFGSCSDIHSVISLDFEHHLFEKYAIHYHCRYEPDVDMYCLTRQDEIASRRAVTREVLQDSIPRLETPKVSWFRRIINWFKQIFK